MVQRITATGARRADVILVQFLQGQVLDPRTRRCEPNIVLARDILHQPPVVMDDHGAVAGKLHVQLGAVAPARACIGKRRQRVFRHQPGAAAMGNVHGLHGYLYRFCGRLRLACAMASAP